jgi:hypothetical protein
MEQKNAEQPKQTGFTPDWQSYVSRPDLQEGWSRPLPEKVPERTYWPLAMSVGIVFALWGIVSSFFVSLAGVLVFTVATAGWVGDLIHEHRS